MTRRSDYFISNQTSRKRYEAGTDSIAIRVSNDFVLLQFYCQPTHDSGSSSNVSITDILEEHSSTLSRHGQFLLQWWHRLPSHINNLSSPDINDPKVYKCWQDLRRQLLILELRSVPGGTTWSKEESISRSRKTVGVGSRPPTARMRRGQSYTNSHRVRVVNFWSPGSNVQSPENVQRKGHVRIHFFFGTE